MIDALDKVQPVTGQMIPAQPPDYLAANHLFAPVPSRSVWRPRAMSSSRSKC